MALLGLYTESNLGNDEWLLNCSYNPQNKEKHLIWLGEYLDLNFLSFAQKKKVIGGGLNVIINENQIRCVCDTYGLPNLKQQPCYKKSNNPISVDLMLTNVPRNFFTRIY